VHVLLSKLAQVTEKGAIQIRKLIGLYCIASSVFVFGLAVIIQGAFGGAMLEAPWLQFLLAETTLFIGPILLFLGGLEACIPQARRMQVLPLGSCALLLLYVVGLAWTGFGQARFLSAFVLVLVVSLMISISLRTPKVVTTIGAGILSALFLVAVSYLVTGILNEPNSVPNMSTMGALSLGAAASVLALILGLLPNKQGT
jgi:hypothetical protein